jgi:hypothetical protein
MRENEKDAGGVDREHRRNKYGYNYIYRVRETLENEYKYT